MNPVFTTVSSSTSSLTGLTVNRILKPGFILSNLSHLTEAIKIIKPSNPMLSRKRQVSPVAKWALHVLKHAGF